MEDYFERGGLRWGDNFIRGSNATWPFATIEVSEMSLTITVGVGRISRNFDFSKNEIEALNLDQAVTSFGLEIQHSRADYPASIIFWTFSAAQLKAALEERGFQVNSGFSEAVGLSSRALTIGFSPLFILFGSAVIYFSLGWINRANYSFNGIPLSRRDNPIEFWVIIGLLWLLAGTLICIGITNIYRAIYGRKSE